MMISAQKFEGRWLLALLAAWMLWLIVMTVPAQAAPAAEPRVHVVQEHETLSAIANRYGTTVEAIIAMNALPHPDVVRAGQWLLIPEEIQQPQGLTPTSSPTPTPAIIHVVQAGETLSSIARRYGTSVEEIARLNQIANVDQIMVGQRLRLPLDKSVMGADGLPAGPLENVSITPWPAMQGQTVTIVVTTSRPISLSVTFNGSQTPFVYEGYRQWALLGIHAMSKPGLYPLRLHATMPLTSTLSGKEPTGTSAHWGETFDFTLRLYVVAGDFPTYNIMIPPSSEKATLLDSRLIRAEQAIVNEIFASRSAGRQWVGRFSYPIAAEALRITSIFGERRSYNNGPATSYHEGIDFGAPEGTPVYAPAAGTVVLAEPLKVRGNALILDHGCGVFTGYWHLSELNVRVGERVRAGDLIARVGSTGLSTGSHLHWELRVGGIAVDPAQWVRQPIP